MSESTWPWVILGALTAVAVLAFLCALLVIEGVLAR